jgi:hypothetical protein
MFGFGGKVTIPFNKQDLDIYANSVREFQDTWIDPNYPTKGNIFEQMFYELTHLRIGQYQVRLGVTNNVTNQIQEIIYIWIIPWRLIFVLLLFLIIIYLYLKRRFHRYTKPKKRIGTSLGKKKK